MQFIHFQVSSTPKSGSQTKINDETLKQSSAAPTTPQQNDDISKKTDDISKKTDDISKKNDDISKVAQKLEQTSLNVAEKKPVIEAVKKTTETVQVKKMSEPSAASVTQLPPAAEPAPKIHSVNLNNNVKGSEKSLTELESVSPTDLPESTNDDFIEGKYFLQSKDKGNTYVCT